MGSCELTDVLALSPCVWGQFVLQQQISECCWKSIALGATNSYLYPFPVLQNLTPSRTALGQGQL